jgi:hypothetical protein
VVPFDDVKLWVTSEIFGLWWWRMIEREILFSSPGLGWRRLETKDE